MFAHTLLVTLATLAVSVTALPNAPRQEAAPLKLRSRGFFEGPSKRDVSKRQYYGQVVTSCVNSGQAAMTFDDGPYLWHRQISDAFTNAGAKTTFFMNGNNWDCIYDSDRISDVQYAYYAGHMVGDHTWSHGDLTTFSDAQLNDGMYRMEEAFSRILGVTPAFMRPPYGDYNGDIINIANNRGQTVVTWDTDTGDSEGASVSSSEQVYNDAVAEGVANMLVLNHETYQTTVDDIMPYAINLLQSHGYELVTLAECLNMNPYTTYGSPQSNNGWTCDGTPDPGDGCSGNCETSYPVYVNGGGGGGGTTTTTTTTTAGGSGPTGTPGTSTIRPYNNQNMCLTATNSNGAHVTLQSCTGATNQKWSYGTIPGETTITAFGGAMCLDVTNGNHANGNQMQVWACGGGNPNQQWYVTADNRIAWYNQGECLDDTNGSTAAGTIVQMWACANNNNNQVWHMV